ncbi:MAG: homocysteine S-methyltransferase family protein [Aridibacter famidurans]|nr:homocysteine S-methyltransferase family protein [Aridibacter famidurans]
MSNRSIFPHTSDRFFVTDGGLETTLLFKEGFELPEFASFVLLKDERGREALRKYFREYLDIALDVKAPAILETATWRANPDWASKIGYSAEELDEMNRASVGLLIELRPEFEENGERMIISGCIGPRGDGYVAGEMMDPEEAKLYHVPQVSALAEAGANIISAITMTYENEAIGIADAAAEAGLPCVISFTVETDGRLPNGSTLKDAIEKVDSESEAPPAYYMINCAHPTHFVDALKEGSGWQERIRGTRVNASKMSHAELDEAEELDEGDLYELAAAHREIRRLLPNLNVAGGCCGTDERHVGEIAKVLAEPNARSA